MHINIEQIFLGIMIGFISGMFGIGGSIISTPILKLTLGLPDLIALASPLPVTIPTAISGSFKYWKSDTIQRKVAFFTIICGLPATVLGALATRLISGKWLMVLTGVFIITVGARLLANNSIKKQSEDNKQLNFTLIASLTGFIAGFLSGLLAIGGGIIIVPAYIILLGMSMQQAAATSLVCIAFFAIPGTITHWILGNIDWNLVLNLSIAVIPASYLGASTGLAIKSDKLKTIFSIFMIIFGAYFVYSQISL